jgi:predicted ribosomally synthesized peptide with nif11-like leader
MSIAEIRRFAADLSTNEALRAEARTAAASTAVFAASKGYAFTADDATTYLKSRPLSDAELGAVVGGSDPLMTQDQISDLVALLLAMNGH